MWLKTANSSSTGYWEEPKTELAHGTPSILGGLCVVISVVSSLWCHLCGVISVVSSLWS
jgi:hypothetical protein